MYLIFSSKKIPEFEPNIQKLVTYREKNKKNPENWCVEYIFGFKWKIIKRKGIHFTITQLNWTCIFCLLLHQPHSLTCPLHQKEVQSYPMSSPKHSWMSLSCELL